MTAATDNDGLCRRCGRCCYAKVVFGDDIFCTDIPCPLLNVATKRCTVYERRFAVNPDCLTVEEGIKYRVFPADCPYVAGLEGYRPPRQDRDPRQMGMLYLGEE